ncbi:hypothetical protein F2Q70_00003258 [Brassica cretica]|uniref:Uncharacterized protein n=1 Tax=Brassica cretica TaxID=69181 RepID=A0A8S9IWF3_BRACR|nr:hypothetical protein F2Q70_00003258 [Brassica cretica]
MVARVGHGASPSGNLKGGVLPRVWRNSIPEYFSPKHFIVFDGIRCAGSDAPRISSRNKSRRFGLYN